MVCAWSRCGYALSQRSRGSVSDRKFSFGLKGRNFTHPDYVLFRLRPHKFRPFHLLPTLVNSVLCLISPARVLHSWISRRRGFLRGLETGFVKWELCARKGSASSNRLRCW